MIELCPVGRSPRRSTASRRGPGRSRTSRRCAASARSAATSGDDARGQGQANPVPQPPEIDKGWLCDKGRFGFTHLFARDRVEGPAAPRRSAALRGALLGRCARPGGERFSRQARPEATCCSRCPEARRSSRRRRCRGSCARGSAPTRSSSRSRPRPRWTPSRAPLSSIGKAERVIVIGDDPVEAAGAGRRALDQGRSAERCGDPLGGRCRNPSGHAWRRGRRRSRTRRPGEGRCPDLVWARRLRRRDRRDAGAGARRGIGVLPPRHPRTAARSSRPGGGGGGGTTAAWNRSGRC